jgi:hypothetical protein
VALSRQARDGARSEMWGEESGGATVSLSCDAERTLSIAWRAECGSADTRRARATPHGTDGSRVLLRTGEGGPSRSAS